MSLQDVEELKGNLSMYKEQLQQVKQLLALDPSNEEYQEMTKGLTEVKTASASRINSCARQTDRRKGTNEQHRERWLGFESVLRIINVVQAGQHDFAACERGPLSELLYKVLELTYDLLNEAQQAKEDADAAALEQQQREAAAAYTQRPPLHPARMFKPQQEKPLSHDIPGRLPVGTKVQAVWSEDGEWYMATVEAVTPVGYFVQYDEWGNKEEVDVSNVRELNIPEGDVEALDAMLGEADGVNHPDADAMFDAEREAEVTRLAIKQKIAQAADVDAISRDLPPKLRIKPDDPEDVKAAKKKKIHAFKSKARLEQMELTQNKRQNSWQQFQTAKGKGKKVGFFTGRKRESIFKSPDDPKGKVGVTGSGKGTTDFHKREKHLHLRVGGEDGDEFL